MYSGVTEMFCRPRHCHFFIITESWLHERKTGLLTTDIEGESQKCWWLKSDNWHNTRWIQENCNSLLLFLLHLVFILCLCGRHECVHLISSQNGTVVAKDGWIWVLERLMKTFAEICWKTNGQRRLLVWGFKNSLIKRKGN